MLWQYRAGQGSALGGMEFGSAVDGEHAYFAVSDDRAADAGRTARRGADDRRARLVRAAAAARAASVDAAARRRFSRPSPSFPAWSSPGRTTAASRAYSTKDGSLLWEFDTNRELPHRQRRAGERCVDQRRRPRVADGMVYVNSGYGALGGRPGNVLLAFGVE